MKPLHSPEDNELEKKSQTIFAHAMFWTGIALLLLMLAALTLLWRPGKHIDAAHPNPHPSSRIAQKINTTFA